MKKTIEKSIELKPINVRTVTVMIEGDGDIVCNKMNNHTVRTLTDIRKDKAKSLEKPNTWEEVITAIHWRDPVNLEPDEYSEELLKELLTNNAPCITSFGLKKSWMSAVVRNEIDTYSTKFDNAVNIVAVGGLVPFTFTNYALDEKLMSPKKGAPVLARLSRFSGWSADVTINYTDNVYSLEQILNIINLAGFGIGIGSGRSSGYGRYHIAGVKG